MIGYWVQFAKTGDPNRDGLPVWPKFDAGSESYLELGEKIKAGDRLCAGRCEELDRILGARAGDRRSRPAGGERASRAPRVTIGNAPIGGGDGAPTLEAREPARSRSASARLAGVGDLVRDRGAAPRRFLHAQSAALRQRRLLPPGDGANLLRGGSDRRPALGALQRDGGRLRRQGGPVPPPARSVRRPRPRSGARRTDRARRCCSRALFATMSAAARPNARRLGDPAAVVARVRLDRAGVAMGAAAARAPVARCSWCARWRRSRDGATGCSAWSPRSTRSPTPRSTPSSASAG